MKHLANILALLLLAACSQLEPNTVEQSATNLIENSGFDGTSDWSFYVGPPMTGQLLIEDGMGKLNIQNSDGTPWKAQLYQNVAVQQGERYTLSFKAKATANRPLQVAIRNNSNYQDSWNETLNLTTTTKSFSYTFTASASNNQQLIFYAGQSGKDVFIDDVSLSAGGNSSQPGSGDDSSDSSVSRPSYNQSSGMFTLNGKLYDANGNEFIARGINNRLIWGTEERTVRATEALDNIANYGFNSVRIMWGLVDYAGVETQDAALDNILKRATDLGLVPIVTLLDFTGSNQFSDLDTAATWWADRSDLWAKYEAHLIINVANEFGGFTLAQEQRSAYRDEYQNVVATLRDAGINATLMIDPFRFGQDYTLITEYGQDIYDADPQKNVLFDVHLYCAYGQTEDSISELFASLSDSNLPFIVGEFSYRFGGDTCEDLKEKAIMAEAQKYGVGYVGWVYGPPENFPLGATKKWEATTRDDLNEWGKTLVYGENGIAETSKPATTFEDSGSAPTPTPSPTPTTSSYEENLELIKSASVRNRNHDNSPFINTPLLDLPLDPATSPLFGPRRDYVDKGEPGVTFVNSGTFRIFCEFSHFSYDDPLVYPNKPGASHLHMYFGNTDANAYSTYDTLKDSGSSTCNGQELNRTGYWVPALFDAQGNVRIPDTVHVYYKGEGLHHGNSEVYPPGAAMISKGDKNPNNVSESQGGVNGMAGKVKFTCTDSWNAVHEPTSDTIPDCANTPVDHKYRILKMHVKFPICWNRQDASNPDNWFLPRNTNWYWGDCEERASMPHLEYFVLYRVELDESTAGWYLASDVDPMTRKISDNPGASSHGDWWGGWHPDINKQWIDNCVNYKSDQPHSCGNGYLSNLGSDTKNPKPGPALKLRPTYTGPKKVAAETLYRELCPQGGEFTSATAAAYCTPANMEHMQH